MMHIFDFLLRERETYPTVEELREGLQKQREQAYAGELKDAYAFDNKGTEMDRRKLAQSLTAVWDNRIKPDFGYTTLPVHEDIDLFLCPTEKEPLVTNLVKAGYYHLTFRGIPIFLDKEIETRREQKKTMHTFQWVNVNLFAEPRRQAIIYNIGTDNA